MSGRRSGERGSGGAGERGKKARIGIMGGSFDPPHIGHLIAAQEVACSLELERVLFVPAGVQPLKRGEPVSPVEDRVQMVELAIAGNPVFALSRADVDRPGPSYTVDLLELLREEYGQETQLYFIIGADSLADLPRWKDPLRLLELCRLVVVPRDAHPVNMAPELDHVLPGARERVLRLPMPNLAVSATDLRARIRDGRPIRYLVPDEVEAYIRAKELYLGAEWQED